jgi:acetyltransferase-like isoleucine patch superfamily enzyme
MKAVRLALRPVVRAARRARFRAWTTRLDLELRARGGRLVVEAGPGVRFQSPPHIHVLEGGGGEGVTTLRLGRDVNLGRDMILELWAGGTNLLEVGQGTTFYRATRVQIRSGAIRLGSGVQIRDFVNVKSLGDLVMGDYAILGHGTTVHAEERVELETMVGLAEYVTVIDSDHDADGSEDTHFMARPLRVAPVHVQRNTFIAAHCTVLKGTRIGPGSVAGAAAVLTGGDYAGSSLIAGSPARVIKALGEQATVRT